MALAANRTLVLESINDGIPVILEEMVGFYKQNCMICFYNQGHRSGLIIDVYYQDLNEQLEIRWSGEITEELKRAYGDLVAATDHAACAVALLLIRELTDYTAIEQSSRGTTIDYYLAAKEQQDDFLIFNQSARLEVSGILEENENNTVKSRIRRKVRRLKPEGDLLNFIIVVEFSKPWSKIVEK